MLERSSFGWSLDPRLRAGPQFAHARLRGYAGGSGDASLSLAPSGQSGAIRPQASCTLRPSTKPIRRSWTSRVSAARAGCPGLGRASHRPHPSQPLLVSSALRTLGSASTGDRQSPGGHRPLLRGSLFLLGSTGSEEDLDPQHARPEKTARGSRFRRRTTPSLPLSQSLSCA